MASVFTSPLFSELGVRDWVGDDGPLQPTQRSELTRADTHFCGPSPSPSDPASLPSDNVLLFRFALLGRDAPPSLLNPHPIAGRLELAPGPSDLLDVKLRS